MATLRTSSTRLLLAFISPLGLAQGAFAQDSSTAGTAEEQDAEGSSVLTGDIIVTAQKNEANIQDVALAVTAYTGEQMQALNLQDATRIVDQVPGFKAGGLGGPSGPPFFNIRGISFVDFSNINEGSVGLYVDEVYQAAQGSGVAQTYDMERVEVLRGPQGTLFGRNTTAGVVHYVTRKADRDEFNGRASLQYGSYNQVIGELAVGGGIAPGLRFRVAGKYNRDDGWQKNTVTGKRHAKTDALGLRGNLQADIGDVLTVELGAHYAKNDGIATALRPYWIFGDAAATTYCGGFTGPFAVGSPTDLARAECLLGNRGFGRMGQTRSKFTSRRITADRDDFPYEYDAFGGYAKFTADLGFANLTSITAIEDFEQLFEYGFDGWDNRPYGSGQVDFNTHFESDARQASQETRLDGRIGGARYVIGAFFYNATQRILNGTAVDQPSVDQFLARALDPIRAQTKTNSQAVFGQVDVPVGDIVTLSGGLRYTHDERSFSLNCANRPGQVQCAPTPRPRISANALSGRAAVELRPQDDTLLYAAYSHGFKSGGFNPVRPVTQRGPVDQETIDNYEVGAKTELFDGRLRLNASAFYYQFKGLQALIGAFDNTGNTNVLYINAGDPRGYGAEFEAAGRITDNFEASFGLALLDTKIKAAPNITADGRPLNGKRLATAPEVSFNGILRYVQPLASGDLSFQVDGRYQSSIFTGVDNDPAEFVKGYGIVNLRAGYTDESRSWSLEAFVDNVFNHNTIQHIFQLTPSSFTQLPAARPATDAGFGVWGRPRLWGVRASYNF
jgi:iron complex outermembrane recepter protein